MRRASVVLASLASALPGCIDEMLAVDGTARPVINGTPTPEGLYPATGALHLQGDVWCTGTLIAPTVVVTAAHCVADLPFVDFGMPGFTLVLDGSSALPQEIVPGRSKHPHPDFDFERPIEPGLGEWYDIGVLLLAEPIEGVAYERLPTPEEAAATLVPGALAEIVGYGLTDQETLAYGAKAHGVATLVEVGEAEILLSMPGEQQNCNGDSGGPAFFEVAGGGRRMFGIVSRSPDDDPVCDHGGVDTRVDRYLDFIAEIAGEEFPDPGPDPDPDPDPDPGDDPEGGCGCRAGGDGGSGAAFLLGAAAVVLGWRWPSRARRRGRSGSHPTSPA